ncbi:MAG: glycosyltransferase family 2 protein [Flavobacteriales bacterium]|nr:glycosyltransferase family 2 protein [Flavobacteriales bacterium]
MANGISVIICCYNSARKLPDTLDHIFRQQVREEMSWETIVINNNSSDNTADVARTEWENAGRKGNFRVVDEPTPGLSNAKRRGFLSASYDLLLYCDDDNWLDEGYVQRCFDIMQQHQEVGILGGQSEAVSDMELPVWFPHFQAQFAVGKQGGEAGDITESRGYVWGAACVFRKAVLDKLDEIGFKNLNTGRKGKKVTAGEDAELCFAAKRLGFRIWYDPQLTFKHFISGDRLTWSYLKKMFDGFGRASIALDYYRDEKANRANAIRQCKKFIGKNGRWRFYLPFSFLNNTDYIWFLYYRGRLKALKDCADYDQNWEVCHNMLSGHDVKAHSK